MIPQKLRLKGIYSYQEEQVVDFEKLAEAQIFGIFGSVGSGKSTLLEAISYALYENTERLPKNNRNYNMMNLKSKELEIDFEFRMQEGEEYRVYVKGRRNKKNFNNVSKLERTIYQKEGQEWQPINKTAEAIIGLSYENFKRTVIIPQGKFEEFLTLTNANRSKMMKEIFGLNRYDLADSVRPILEKNNTQKNNVEGQLEQLADTSKEAAKEAEEKLKTEKEKGEHFKKELEKIKTEVNAATVLQQLFKQAALATSTFENLNLEVQKYELLSQGVKDTRYCTTFFKPKLDDRKELTEDINKTTKELTEITQRLEKIEEQQQQKAEEYEKVKAIYDNKAQEEDRAEELGECIKIQELDKQISAAKEALKEKEANVADCKKRNEVEEKSIKNLQERIKKAEKNRPNSEELTKLQIWFFNHKMLNESQKVLRSELKIGEEKYKAISVNFRKIITKSGCSIKAKGINEAIEELEKEKDNIKAEKNLAENKKIELSVHTKLESIAAQLEDGKPCLVCGATEHPEPMSSEQNQKKLAVIEEEIVRLDAESSNLDNCINDAKILKSEAKTQHQTIKEIKAELAQKEEEAKEHLATFESKSYTVAQEKEVQIAQNELSKIDESLRKNRQLLEQARSKKQQCEQEERQILENLSDIKIKLAQGQSDRNVYYSQLKTVKYEDVITLPVEQIEQQVKAILQKIIIAEQRYDVLDKEIDVLEKEKNQVIGTQTQLKKHQEELQKRKSKLEAELNDLIQQSNYKEEANIIAILDKKLDLESAENQIQEFKTQYKQAEKEHLSFQEKIKGQTFDEQDFATKVAKLSELGSQLVEQNQKIGAQKSILDTIKEKLKQKKALVKNLAGLTKREANIKLLSNLFKGEGFVEYISTVYLQNLCNAANYRFAQLTKQQLRLELNKDNSFDVRDYLNDGKLRSAKTLSGGQIFQASLSLALALAASVQKQSEIEQNFFFLDEGFGTQDKDSLQIIFEALKSLRKENCTVGIISHVEDLQQEISVFLDVKKDDESGSKIKASWE